jgi:hypothetical protein
MSNTQVAKGAHLVGSVSLDDSEAVISTAAKILGNHLERIPDGETGPRQHWAFWQFTVIEQDPNLEQDPDEAPRPFPLMKQGVPGEIVIRPARFKAGTDLGSVLMDTTYATHALTSYEKFKALREQGNIAAGTKFMVALPTPLAIALPHISPSHIPDFLKVYERSLIADLKKILAAIPAADLSIQWDIAVEVIALEGGLPIPMPVEEFEEQSLQQFERLCAEIPQDVEMGFHWCYGDPGGEHIVEPTDAGLMVHLTQQVLKRIARPIQYIHLPVPIERDDDAFFEPLAKLQLPAGCKLYLGLVHVEDGNDGANARIATASKYIKDFGVATECGIGRLRPSEIEPVMQIHADCAAPVA